MPKNDLSILNQLVDAFYDLVKVEFENRIDLFLKEVEKRNPVFTKTTDPQLCALLSDFINSTLENKREKLPYDTVFISHSYKIGKQEYNSVSPVIITVTQDGDTSWTNEIIPIYRTIEVILQQERQRGYWNHISDSSFLLGLEKSISENPDILTYVDAKRVVGEVHLTIIAGGLIESKLDTQDYFIKRIIVFEIFRRELEMIC